MSKRKIADTQESCTVLPGLLQYSNVCFFMFLYISRNPSMIQPLSSLTSLGVLCVVQQWQRWLSRTSGASHTFWNVKREYIKPPTLVARSWTNVLTAVAVRNCSVVGEYSSTSLGSHLGLVLITVKYVRESAPDSHFKNSHSTGLWSVCQCVKAICKPPPMAESPVRCWKLA